jgi:hypothetical protein
MAMRDYSAFFTFTAQTSDEAVTRTYRPRTDFTVTDDIPE